MRIYLHLETSPGTISEKLVKSVRKQSGFSWFGTSSGGVEDDPLVGGDCEIDGASNAALCLKFVFVHNGRYGLSPGRHRTLSYSTWVRGLHSRHCLRPAQRQGMPLLAFLFLTLTFRLIVAVVALYLIPFETYFGLYRRVQER